jgi:CO/xanthine dehydrogenase FAD-binding subunit
MTFSLVVPSTPAEAFRALGQEPRGSTHALAGGTDLLRDVDDGKVAPTRVVSLRALPWRKMEHDADGITIGSTLPFRDVETDPRIRRSYPGLWESIRSVGSVSLRHRATLGGNLARASPASDLIPILLAHEALVSVVSASGDREVPIAEFVLGSRRTTLQPGELIRSIRIPHPGPSTYVWQRVRPANDISQVGVAVLRPRDRPGWRVALGGVSPVAQRIPEVEACLRSATPSDSEVVEAAREAAERAPFVTDKRASEAYRRKLVGVLVERAVRAVRDPPRPEATR